MRGERLLLVNMLLFGLAMIAVSVVISYVDEWKEDVSFVARMIVSFVGGMIAGNAGVMLWFTRKGE